MEKMSVGINVAVDNKDVLATIWGSLQVCLAEEDKKISGRMQTSR